MIIATFKKHGANVLTIINMILGLIAIILSVNGQYFQSALMILIAAFTDRLDGMVARKYNTTSALGKYLDSNSDLVSFGLAPGLLIYFFVLSNLGLLGITGCFLYVIAGAFRLARYNAVEFNGFYVGLPITIAGAIIGLVVLIPLKFPSLVYFFTTLVLSYAMISKHSIKKR